MWPNKQKESKCDTCKYKFSDRNCKVSCNYEYYLTKVISSESSDTTGDTNGMIIRELSDIYLS